MSKKDFYIKAIWDKDAGVFVSESDIIGLHIEAKTIEEFHSIMRDNALDLVFANHVSPQELTRKKLTDLIPTIFWERQGGKMAAA